MLTIIAHVHTKILLYWQQKESEFPRLSAMARDLLCIPATETGVERVFSAARDVCGYRRGQLSPNTIRAIMLVYYSRRYNSRQSSNTQSHYTSLDDIMDTTDMTDD